MGKISDKLIPVVIVGEVGYLLFFFAYLISGAFLFVFGIENAVFYFLGGVMLDYYYVVMSVGVVLILAIFPGILLVHDG